MAVQILLYGLDGTAYDITGEAFSVDVGAGRDTERDVFDAGGGTIQVRNLSRNFDPFFATSSDFLLQADDASRILQASGDGILLASPSTASAAGDYAAMVQGRKLVVKDGGVTVFTGFVEDFEYEWARGPQASATLLVKDALATLGRTSYLEHTRTDNEMTGARITAMLNRAEVAFPAATRNISTGLVACQGDFVSHGSNVLNDLQNIAKTEFGRLFVSRGGTLTFLDRYAVFGATPTASFNDLAPYLPFSGVRVTFGSESLWFSVSVDREGGIAQTVTNTAAQAANPNLGARHLTMSGLLFTADIYSKALATYLADRYSRSEAIVSSLTVPLSTLGSATARLSVAQRALVCGLEIGNVVSLDWTPTGHGLPVSQVLAIEGWHYTASHTAGDITASMSFQLSDARDPEFLVYDTDAYDSGKVYGF